MRNNNNFFKNYYIIFVDLKTKVSSITRVNERKKDEQPFRQLTIFKTQTSLLLHS